MKYGSGLDVSMKETSICIVDEKGNIIFEKSTSTDPKCTAKDLKDSGFIVEKVALETGSLSLAYLPTFRERLSSNLC